MDWVANVAAKRKKRENKMNEKERTDDLTFAMGMIGHLAK